MKKFKNIKELKEHQSHLQKRNKELEKIMKYDWKDVKSGFVSDTVSYGKSLLLQKLTESVKNYFARKNS